ncbi:MAG TPA: hypothetical protein VIN40_01670 [Candidatus Tyrphobacter sp.]
MAVLFAALAALWLLGLWAAAPILRGGPRLADRVRDALVIGTAIPLVLGFTHLLYAPLCWLVLIACIAGAVARRRREPGFREPVPYLLFAALAFVAWPPLVRPLLDGDTLSYHLPNAAAWVHAHSIWTTQTRYWWYPPASEAFASALYAVSSPYALGWAGIGPIALLGLRLFAWAREGALLPTRLADALAAATICILPIALQTGSLQNDVWLAAFFVEILWSAPVDDFTVLRSAALCALIKPDGWIYATVALAASRARPRAWIAAGAVAALWILHDAILWHGAFVPPASTAFPHLWRSTMLAHPLGSLRYGFVAAVRFAPFGFLLLLFALGSPRLGRDRPLNVAGIAAVAVALLMPFGFADAHLQLATGASLRYLLPAMAVGALILAPFLLRFPRLALRLLLFAIAGEALGVLAVYWNDRVTLAAFAAAVAVPLAVAFARRARSRAPLAVAAAIAIVLTTVLAMRTGTRFYADALAVRGHRSGVYAWLARTQPARVAGWGLRIGTVAVLSPRSLAVDVPDADPCGHARLADALLVAVAEPTHSDSFNRLRIHDAALCGTVLYRDPIAVVILPRASF